MPARGADAARRALSDVPGVEVVAMDLLDPASVRGFADGFLAERKPLDLLILSAGVMATPLFRDAEGHEGQFATNHLGHFRLTAALWPALRAANGARVVVLSSRGHQLGGLDLDDLDFIRRPYDKWLAYEDCDVAPVEAEARSGVRRFAIDPDTAEALWSESVRMAGWDLLSDEG